VKRKTSKYKRILSFVVTTVYFLCSFLLLGKSVLAEDYIQPRHTSSISNNEFSPLLAYPEFLAISGHYLFTTPNISNALVVFDITNPASLVQVGYLQNGDGGAKLNSPESLFISGNYAYIITGTNTTGDTLEIVDISNPVNPTHVGSISNGEGGANFSGGGYVFVLGNYAYIPAYTQDALVIINISNPVNPTFVGSIANGTGGAALDGAFQIYVSGDYAYVTAWWGDALEIINISNPASPTHAGKILNGTGGAKLNAPSGIQVLGDFAYISSYDSSYAFEIVNVSDPANPIHAGSIANGEGGAKIHGYEHYISGNYAYLSTYIGDAIEIVDISNPASPTHVGLINDGDGGALLQLPRGIVISGNNAYVAVSGSNAIEVINISNPVNPTHVSSISPSVYLGSPTDLTILNNRYAYVLAATSNALQVIDILDPAHPVPKGSLPLRYGGAQLHSPKGIAFKGNYGYIGSTGVVDGIGALEIIDISNPAYPTHVNSILNGPYQGGVYGLVISGNYAYITAYGQSALKIIDITTDPVNPTLVGSLANGGGALLGGAYGIAVSGNYAFITSSTSNALEVVNITDPANPVHAGSLANGAGGAILNSPRQIYISGNYAYITSWTGNALEIVNISNPANPTHVGKILNGAGGALLGNAFGVSISGNYAYIGSSSSNALEIINISNPANPTHHASVIDGAGGAKLNMPRGVYISGDYIYVVASNRPSLALEIIRIKDSVPPVISNIGSSEITVSKGIEYVDAGITALDDVDGNVIASVVTVGSVDTNTIGTYTITYNVTDLSNNIATEKTKTITVIERQNGGPVALLSPPITSPTIPPTIIPSPPITPKIISGCTSNIGFSNLTGESCANAIINTSPIIYQTLRIKNTGEDVLSLQNYLYTNKYFTDIKDLDSIFGPRTKNAVILFQKDHNLVPDGIVGPLTRGEMK
jgi:hypothetical protein